MSVQIAFNDYQFHTEGRAQFGRSVLYEADTQGGVPRRAITTWTIDEWFTEPGFADNQWRLDALNKALKATEGTLKIIDENGTTIYRVTARPGRNNLPVAWNENIAEVQVTFTSREEIRSAYPPGVSFTPAGYVAAGLAPIALQNPSAWKETLKTDRFSSAVSNRKETIATITASGKIFANPDCDEITRRRWLDALKARIEAVDDCADGELSFLMGGEIGGDAASTGFCKTVRVEHFEADIHESDYLTWSLSAFYRRFTTNTFNGTAYAPDETTADGLINMLVGSGPSRTGGPEGGWHIKDERDASYETDGTTLVFMGKSFALSWGTPTAAGSDSILEAEYTLEVQGQVNHAVLTEIPYDYPYVQTGVGYNKWKKVVSGSVTALTAAAAQSWGQSLAAQAYAGGYAEPSNERTQTSYYPLSGTSVKSYRFTFVYQAQFA
jgi:hypothetical protein